MFLLSITDNHSSDNFDLRSKKLAANDSKRIKRSYSHERHIEIMVVADSKMAYYHGDNLRHYILTLMATVSDYIRTNNYQ
jgi:hypothetical protein